LYEDGCELLISFSISLEQPVIALAKKYYCSIGHVHSRDIEAQLTKEREFNDRFMQLYRYMRETKDEEIDRLKKIIRKNIGLS